MTIKQQQIVSQSGSHHLRKQSQSDHSVKCLCPVQRHDLQIWPENLGFLIDLILSLNLQTESNMDQTYYDFGLYLEVNALSGTQTPWAVVTLPSQEETLGSKKCHNVHM